MIVSFRDDWLHDFYIDDLRSRHIPPDLEARLFRRLKMVDAATTDCAAQQSLRAAQG